MEEKMILLVEDNPSDVKLTLRAFEKNHLANEVTVASDGQEALDFLFGTGPHAGRDLADQPVLILLDLRLPKMDGLEVLKEIRQNPSTRRLPVVILTTSNEEPDLAAAYDLGANSYIRKPVDYAEFYEAVSSLGVYWLAINEEPPPVKHAE